MTGARPQIWTEERVAELRRLHDDGLSAGTIAFEMRCGLTRNAVIGKLHRLGIKDGVTVEGRKRQSENGKVNAERLNARRRGHWHAPRKPAPAVTHAEPARVRLWPQHGAHEVPTGIQVRLADTTPHQCLFIAEAEDVPKHGQDSLCCGAPTFNGSSWCAHHFAICFVPPKDRRPVRVSAGDFEIAAEVA